MLLVEKIPKKRFGFLFGYIGSNYFGSQINHGMELSQTVEGNFFETFKKMNLISDQNFENSTKIGMNRNSRTDRDKKKNKILTILSVHSTSTVLSAKLMIKEEELEEDPLGFDISDKVNENLPDDMYIISTQKTTRNFSAKNFCIYRSYEYLLPLKYLNLKNDEDKILKLNFYLEQFLGTNFYHNFATMEQNNFVEKYENENQFRSINVSDLFRREIVRCHVKDIAILNNKKYAKIEILSNSFLKHQIRRIIGTIIGIINGKYFIENLIL